MSGRAGLILLATGGLFSGLNVDRITGSGSTLQALGILAAIVTIHECGHFVAARVQNIHVKEFSIGFGPKLLGFKGAEVDYSLRAIPLGGYVAFPDDDPDLQYPADDPDLLLNRPIRDRAIVVSAGVIANVIFAWSILFAQACTIGMATPVFEAGVRVPEVVSTSVAAKAGLRAGDVIMSVGKSEIPAAPSAVARVVNAIMDSPEHSMDLGVRRKGEMVHVAVTPALGADGSGRIGVQLASNLTFTHSPARNAVDATRAASVQLARCFGIVLGGLWQLISNVTGAAGSLSGPIAIVKVGADAAKADVAGLYQFAALVNVNLAVTNILPLPALDGGALAFLIVESVRGGKKLPKVLEQTIMAGGLVLLMGLGVVLIVRDTLHLGGLG
ncbi:hypothetical protein WJX73_009389 [Symbiochloris irregularis]|uniref:PDZ domain-containing protein n=1 Tax=Symbiochloris irregularis TaxID=706552 RepID=A0AAW1PJL8_9CHLO